MTFQSKKSFPQITSPPFKAPMLVVIKLAKLLSFKTYFYFNFRQLDAAELSSVLFSTRSAAPIRGLTPVCSCVLCGLFYMFTVSLTSDPKHRGQQAEDIPEYFGKYFMMTSQTRHKSVLTSTPRNIAQLFFFF